MKVRWSRDSLRLRITPSEMDAIGRGEPVRDGIAFPGGQAWGVAILPAEGDTTLASGAEGVHVRLSAADRAALARPEAEGVYFRSDTAPPVRYYVEKDFPCAHPRAAEAGEQATETFPAPAGFDQRKSEEQKAGAEINGD